MAKLVKRGRLDFYIGEWKDKGHWGAELMRKGAGIARHKAKMKPGGYYFGKNIRESILLDFRLSFPSGHTHNCKQKKYGKYYIVVFGSDFKTASISRNQKLIKTFKLDQTFK